MTYRQGKWTLFGALTDVVPEILGALKHDLLVIVELVATAAGTGLEDRASIVVPLKASIGVVPVDSPAKVAGVNITGETLFVAVELVTDKVHLTRQSSVVALASQVVSVGGDLGADLRGIVKGTNLHW